MYMYKQMIQQLNIINLFSHSMLEYSTIIKNLKKLLNSWITQQKWKIRRKEMVLNFSKQ